MYILDVGANLGDFGIQLAKRNPRASIYLLEPIPELADNLSTAISKSGLGNVWVYDLALSDTDGEAVLNISVDGDLGTTSLLSFDREKIEADEYWSTRSDLVHKKKLMVKTLRLDTFMKQECIPHVDFIKIDAQGFDLTVLASAGNYLEKIQAGMLEVPTTSLTALYINEVQTLRSALNFLEHHGFTIMAIKPNDPACNEVNVFFSRDPKAWQENLSRWGLIGLSAFDGKHYWELDADRAAKSAFLAAQTKRIKELDCRVVALETVVTQDSNPPRKQVERALTNLHIAMRKFLNLARKK